MIESSILHSTLHLDSIDAILSGINFDKCLKSINPTKLKLSSKFTLNGKVPYSKFGSPWFPLISVHKFAHSISNFHNLQIYICSHSTFSVLLP